MPVTSKLWSLFFSVMEGEAPCPAMLADYDEIDDDPELPPYLAPMLYCTALNSLLRPEPVVEMDIPF